MIQLFSSKKKKKQKSMYHLIREHYGTYYETAVIDENAVLYETRDGASITDSPYAIFLKLVADENYQHLKHIWVLKKDHEEALLNVPEAYRQRITVVERDTLEYVDAMLTSKYVITNSTFQTFFVKRPNQVYINTWHGTPLKLMGFDMPGAIYGAQNVMRNFLMTDYLLSPNAHTTDIFKRAYKLNDVYEGTIIEHGYPRIDLTLNAPKSELQAKLSTFGIVLDETKKTLLYTPTWRGKAVGNAQNTIEQTVQEVEQLTVKFSNEYNILIKAHPFAYKHLKDDERLAGHLISDYLDANELLSLVDVLVTDYSSIFFDFLVTDKPIIFYVWDKEVYLAERGMYLELDTLPGPTAESMTNLIDLLSDVEQAIAPYQANYRSMKERMVAYDNGQVTEDYLDIMFNGKERSDVKQLSLKTDKKKLLIYPGGMRKNGITTSFLNLMDNINYEQYDVTVLADEPKLKEVRYNFDRLNSNVRCLYRTGASIWSVEEAEDNRRLIHRDFDSDEPVIYPERAYRRDVNRLLGNLTFDAAIDFSGYSLFWAKNILGAQANRYLVFAHNDLYADAHREVNGEMPMYRGLRSLFENYYKFDKIISVSPMTMAVNQEKLSEFVKPEQMTYAVNTINIQAILGEHAQEIVEDSKQVEKLIVKEQPKELKNSGEVVFFDNLEKLKNHQGQTIIVNSTDKITSIATLQENNQSYDKVLLNDLPLGWIASDYLSESLTLVVENISDYVGLGTVARKLDNPIWKGNQEGPSENTKVAYARDFKGTYLMFSKLAKTSKGDYVLVSHLGQELGWLAYSSLTRIHKLSRFSPLWLYYRTRANRLAKQLEISASQHVEPFQYYVKNKESVTELPIWQLPDGVTNSQLLESTLVNQYLGEVLETVERVKTSKGNFIGVTLRDSSMAYIEEKHLDILTAEQSLQALKEKAAQQVALEKQAYQLPKYDLAGSRVEPLDPDYCNFINMGRLSPEKNQVALIKGFALFNQKHPKTRLYILGKGPLEEELIAAVKETKMTEHIFVLGHLDNPFRFVSENDVFVLPSFYEGQPMVLLESLTLGLPLLVSDIPANRNVVGDETYGLYINGFEPTDIELGLEYIYLSDRKFKRFDYLSYNEDAINDFYHHLI
ncbi:CDP-glycerol glycerophosphotransferase family protein [Vagococcus zengguangii]|uniref:Glycosyltransferase n=1 Tax=Vagococcus zengguangii TaxID=2571750 RepID=A0A4D7CSJ7_9ENTE|nr:CDP-glycerol glycerophosphotransferase family protein [Vagococcus zengguangii]QCI87038.1 glycosyltransferase [Vagococcus zengguangii]